MTLNNEIRKLSHMKFYGKINSKNKLVEKVNLKRITYFFLVRGNKNLW